VFGRSAEGARAQVEHYIAHRTHRETASPPVDAPVHCADEEHCGGDKNDRCYRQGAFEVIERFADHDRLHGSDDRHDDGQHSDKAHPFFHRRETADDPFHQIFVFVLAVVFFFVKTFVKTHNSLRERTERREQRKVLRSDYCSLFSALYSLKILEYASDVFINSS
jgi:hypothetical protein